MSIFTTVETFFLWFGILLSLLFLWSQRNRSLFLSYTFAFWLRFWRTSLSYISLSRSWLSSIWVAIFHLMDNSWLRCLYLLIPTQSNSYSEYRGPGLYYPSTWKNSKWHYMHGIYHEKRSTHFIYLIFQDTRVRMINQN